MTVSGSADLEEAIARLPAAARAVPRAATQIPSDEIATYADLLDRLTRLDRESSRVRVENLGYSRGGRAIPVVLITNDANDAHLDEFRRTAVRAAAPQVTHRTPARMEIVESRLSKLPAGFRVPILIQSSNFGMEVAQQEALVALAERLAWDADPEIVSALDSVVLLIVPVINPDGYEAALRHWRARPGSAGHLTIGNHFDIEVTREYLHLVEPETWALAGLVERWHPYLVWEVHEDGLGLTWTHPQTCLCPPIGPYATPGVDSSIAPVVDDPDVYAEFQAFGERIAQVWRERGFAVLHDSLGAHGWPRLSTPESPEPPPCPEARFTQTMLLRGVTAFITESARTPGSQTWADRVEQKVAAGLAVVATAAGRRDALLALVTRRQEPPADDGFFLLPMPQDSSALGRAIDILLGHGIKVYRAQPDGLGAAVVVPRSQPLADTVDVLLDVDAGRHLSLAATLGLRVVRSAALDDAERSIWADARLAPVFGSASVAPEVALTTGYVRIANTHDGVRLVARLLARPSAAVRWAAPAGGNGFVALLEEPEIIGTDLGMGLRADIEGATPADYAAATPLRLPRIGLWARHGVHENTYNGTLARWALSEWGLPYRIVTPAQIPAGDLTELDALIVPAGNAETMASGIDPDSRWQRFPWEPDFDLEEIGDGADALRNWVRGGGTYVGIDSGGGRLAGREHLGITDASAAVVPAGIGMVELQLEQRDHPLFDGLRGSYDADGRWRDGMIRAMFVANPGRSHPGGCGFRGGPGTRELATLGEARPVSGIDHILPTPLSADGRPYAAIMESDFGRGTVLVIGVEPTYRGTFRSSSRLLANALFASALSS